MKRRILSVSLGLASIVVSAFAFFALQANTQAAADFGSCTRDNDSNAVIRGGACDTNELASKYKANTNTGVPELYKAFGVPTNFSSAVKGEVRKNGDVVVDGKVVATGAITVGRHYMTGSTKKTYGGHTFYERAPSVSFASNSLKAFVFFNKDGEFQAAVLTACGNAVKGHPKPKPAYACTALKAIEVDRTHFDLTVTTAQHRATVKSVTFNVYKGSTKVESKTSTSTTYRYAQPATGTYTVKAVVTFSVEGQGDKTTAESAACSTSFEVKDIPEQPAYACTGLTATKIDRTNFRFATSTSEKKATFKSVTYVISNEAGQEVQRFNATTKTSDYSRSEEGKYSVRAIVTFTVEGQGDKTVEDAKCSANFEVEKITEQPAYACTDLAVAKVGRTNFTFTTSTTEKLATFKKVTYVIKNASGAEIDRFDATSKTSQYVQNTAGTYSVQAIPTFTVDGQDKTHISDACKATISVEEAPQYSCDGLTTELVGKVTDRTYKYNLTYTAKNGATLVTTDFDFGDGATQNGVTVAGLANVSHKYAATGDYTTTATLHFNVGNAVTEAKCAVKITTSPDEEKPCPYNPELPIGHPDCHKQETPCPYNPSLPVGHPDCKKPEVCQYNPALPPNSPDCKKEACQYNSQLPVGSTDCHPTEIAKTGPGETMTALAGLGSLSAAGIYYRQSRRELLGKLRNRR